MQSTCKIDLNTQHLQAGDWVLIHTGGRPFPAKLTKQVEDRYWIIELEDGTDPGTITHIDDVVGRIELVTC